MLKKTLTRLLLTVWLAAGLAAGWALPVAAAKDARAQRFDVAVTAQADGSLLVTETVVFAYTGGPFTFVTRDLPTDRTDRTDGIEIVEARMDGALLPPGDQAGQVEISGDDPVEVRWHFAPTSDAVHEFTLIYRALGVVEKTAAADLLRWQALPDEHDYAIDSSTITLSYPETAEPLGAATVEEFQAAVTGGAAQTTVTAQNLGEDDTLIVALRFAPGSLTTQTPVWQARADQRAALTQQYAWPMVALALLLGLGGSALAYVLWRPGQPEALSDEGPVMSPPSALNPALVGALTSGQGEPGVATALGTLFDLARRGVVAIVQEDKKGWLGQMSPAFVVTLRERPAGLAAHEQQLLDQFFGPAAAPGASAPLTEKMPALVGKWKQFAEPVKATLRQRGWWDEARVQRRGGWIILGVVVMLVSLFSLIAAEFLRGSYGDLVFLLPLGGFVAGLVTLILGSSVSPYSDTGRAEAARWNRFSKYLSDVIANREAVVRTDLFEHYLAYAAALGLAQGWVDFFKKRGETAIPAWFQPLAGADGSSSMGALVAVISSSGASGAGASGAGAAGGGGSSTG